MKAKKTHRVMIRLPEDLHDKAKAKAEREDITLSQVLRRALREWVEEGSGKEGEEP